MHVKLNGLLRVARISLLLGQITSPIFSADSDEKARLEKSAGKLAKEINGLTGRLSNPKFAASAPEEVVEDTRQNLQLRSEEASKIAKALQRLEDMG